MHHRDHGEPKAGPCAGNRREIAHAIPARSQPKALGPARNEVTVGRERKPHRRLAGAQSALRQVPSEAVAAGAAPGAEPKRAPLRSVHHRKRLIERRRRPDSREAPDYIQLSSSFPERVDAGERRRWSASRLPCEARRQQRAQSGARVGQSVLQRSPEGVEVAGRRSLRSFEVLRRHVSRCATSHRGAERKGQPKVDDAPTSTRVHQQMLGLEVAMDEPALMKVLESGQQVGQNRRASGRRR